MVTPNVQVLVEASGPLLMLERIEAALLPAGLTFFLGAEVGPYLVERSKQRFANEGDDVVGRWAPLKPATVQIRESATEYSVGGDHPINHRTGELEDWITGTGWSTVPTGAGATLRYPSKPPGNAELKQKVMTAQQGRGYPNTVPRPVLGVNQTDLLFVTTRLFFYLEGKIKGL